MFLREAGHPEDGSDMFVRKVGIAYTVSQTVAVQSKERTVFACSNTIVVGSNPFQCMNVYVRLFCVCVVLCVGSGLAMG
jgi:hypothetical protein